MPLWKIRYKPCAILLLFILYSLSGACSGGGGSSDPMMPPAPVNQAPVANAGEDQSGIEGDWVSLSASASTDSDGTINAFSWRQVSGRTVVLDQTDASEIEFQIPLLASDADITFELTVTDDDGRVATDTVNVSASLAPVSTLVEIETEFDAEARAYSVYTPASYMPGSPAVLLLHGGEGSMRELLLPGRTTFDFIDKVETNGHLLIVPNGYDQQGLTGLGDDQSWNDLRPDPQQITSQEDDEGFLLAVLSEVQTARGHDPERLLVTGASNGGMMSFRLLINQPQAFIGAASLIAALPEEAVPDPAMIRPLMILNGTEDKLVLFDGGPVAGNRPATRSVADTVAYWQRVTGSGTPILSLLPDLDVLDGCTIQLETYASNATGEVMIQFYTAIGGGHNIPDPETPPFPPQVRERTEPFCRDANGVDLAYDFFLSLL